MRDNSAPAFACLSKESCHSARSSSRMLTSTFGVTGKLSVCTSIKEAGEIFLSIESTIDSPYNINRFNFLFV